MKRYIFVTGLIFTTILGNAIAVDVHGKAPKSFKKSSDYKCIHPTVTDKSKSGLDMAIDSLSCVWSSHVDGETIKYAYSSKNLTGLPVFSSNNYEVGKVSDVLVSSDKKVILVINPIKQAKAKFDLREKAVDFDQVHTEDNKNGSPKRLVLSMSTKEFYKETEVKKQ